MESKTVSTAELMGDHLTRAQVSFWMESGYISPVGGRKGQGYPLRWDADTVRLARHMATLVDAGFSVESAYQYGMEALAYFKDRPNAKVWTRENGGIIVGLRRVFA